MRTSAGPRQLGSALRVLVPRTLRDAVDDRLPGLAAELSFYTVLSLPPLLLVGLGLLGFFGQWAGPETVTDIQDQILDWAETFLTDSTMEDVVEPAVEDLLERGRADILSLSVLVAIWSGSRAMRVFIEAVTLAYDLPDRRSWPQRAVLGLALTLAGLATVVVLLPLLVVGPEAGASLAGEIGLAQAFEITLKIVYWPIVAAIGVSLLTWVYHIVPPWTTAWRRDLPGAVLALVGWLAGSFGLRIYAVNFIESNSAYSLFAAPLVVLLWIYVTAIALLLGAEFNAEIEKVWPTPGGPYEVVPETVS